MQKQICLQFKDAMAEINLYQCVRLQAKKDKNQKM